MKEIFQTPTKRHCLCNVRRENYGEISAAQNRISCGSTCPLEESEGEGGGATQVIFKRQDKDRKVTRTPSCIHFQRRRTLKASVSLWENVHATFNKRWPATYLTQMTFE